MSKDIPAWWSKLSTEMQKAYLIRHPNSGFKLTPRGKVGTGRRKPRQKSEDQQNIDMKKDAVDALKRHPEHRAELREKLAHIKEDPTSALPDDFDDRMSPEALDDDEKEAIEKDAKKVSSAKDFKRLARRAMIAVGLGVIGGGLLMTGGLPYALLTVHLLRDAKDAFQDFNDRIAAGEDTLKATFGATKTWATSAISNGTLLASSLVMNTRNDDRKSKVTRPTAKTGKDDTTAQENKEAFDKHKEAGDRMRSKMREAADIRRKGKSS